MDLTTSTEILTDHRGVEYVNGQLPFPASGWAHCPSCDRSWNDALSTSVTPTPSGRCPFEELHACAGCNAESGEPCSPFCTGLASVQEAKLDVSQTISFGTDLPTSFADAVRGLTHTIGKGGAISVRMYDELTGNVGEPVDYQLRTVTTDPELTRDGEPHLAVIRCNEQGELISRAVELLPLDMVHTLHVY